MATEHNFKVKKGLDVLGGDVNLGDGFAYKIDGTTVVDSSRNLTNISTISSGAITGSSLTVSTSGTPTLTLYDTGNGGAGSASAKIKLKNTDGIVAGIGYTGDLTTDTDLIISTNAAGTYGGYLDLDAAALADAQSDIILEPKTNVRIATGGLKIGTTTFVDSSRNITAGTISTSGKTSIAASASTSSSGSLKLHVGTINNTGSSAIAQFGGFIRASEYYILHASTGSTDSLFIDYVGDDMDITDGEGSYSGVLRANGYKVGTTTVIDSSRNLSNIGSLALSSSITLNNNQKIYFKNSSGTSNSFIYRAGGDATRFEYADNVFIFDAASDTDFEIRNSSDVTVFKVDVGATAGDTSVYSAGNVNAGSIQTASTTRITSSGNLTNIGSISSGAITATGASSFVDLAVGGAADSNYDLKVYGLARFEGTSNFTGDVQVGGFTVITSARNMQNIGNINISGYYAMDGVTIIDTSKNLTNIGTISSGAITSSGVITASGTNSSTAPRFRFEGDTDTGLASVSANAVGLIAGGSRKFYVNETTAYFQNLTGGVTMDRLTVNTDATNEVLITATDSTANTAFNAVKIDHNISGSDATTTDRQHIGLYVDVDSTATGGDTSHEHRIYGVYADVQTSGDSDLMYGGYFHSRANNFTGTISHLRGSYGLGVAHNNTGTITNTVGGYNYGQNYTDGTGQANSVTGAYNQAYAASTSSYASSNYYGSWNIAQVGAGQTANINSVTGVYGEVQLDNNTVGTPTISSAYVFRAEYDENDSDDSYTVNTGYLFYGNYAGTQPTTAYGIYIADAVTNYFNGYVRTSTGYQVGTTTVIDNGRNLLNIGSISASTLTTSGDITVSGNQVFTSGSDARVKFAVWSNDIYGMGMTSGVTYGGMNNDYAMTFQMNNDADRGWLFLDSDDTLAQGAMGITTAGKVTIADAVRIGFGKGDTTAPASSTAMLNVNGTTRVTTSEFQVTSSNAYITHLNYQDSGQNYISQATSGGLTQFRNSSEALMEIASSGNVTITNNLTVGGNLVVNGTTTTINTANLNVEDNNITLNYGTGSTVATANGSGITIQDAMAENHDATILWDTSNDRFNFSDPINVGIVGLNQQPGTDSLNVAGYGIIGNRTAVYLTNANSSGTVQIGVGGAHNANPKLTIGSSDATFATHISSTGNIVAAGELDGATLDISGNGAIAGYLNFDGGSQNGLIRFNGNNAIGYSNNFLYINASNHFTSGVYINSSLKVDTGLIGSYNEDLQLRTANTTALTLSNANQDATFAGNIRTDGYLRFGRGSEEIGIIFEDSATNDSIYHTINDGQGNYNIMLGVNGAGTTTAAGDGQAKIMFTGHSTSGGVSLNAGPTVANAGTTANYSIGLSVDGSDNTIRVGNPNNSTGLTPGGGYTKVFDNSGNAFASTFTATTGIQLGAGHNLTWGGVYASNFPAVAANSSGSSGFVNVYPGGASTGAVLHVDSGGADIKGRLRVTAPSGGHITFELGSRDADPAPTATGSYDFKPGMRVIASDGTGGAGVDADDDIIFAWNDDDHTSSSEGYLASTQTYATASFSKTFNITSATGARFFAKVKMNDAESGNDPRIAVNGGTEYKLEYGDAPNAAGEAVNDADSWHVIDITDDVGTGSNTFKAWLAAGQKTYIIAVYIFKSTGIMLPNEPYESVAYSHKGFGVGDTRIVTEDRNLINIGTISSGNISSGNITATKYGFADTEHHLTFKSTSSISGATADTTEVLGRQIDLYAYDDIRLRAGTGDKIVLTAAGADRFQVDTNTSILAGDLKMGTNTVIDSSRNITAGTISSGNITAGNSSTAAYLRAHYSDGSYMTLEGYGLEMNRGASYIRPTTDGNKTLYIGGADASLDWLAIHFRSVNGLYMSGTQFLTSSRVLNNIAGITSSGTHTFTANDVDFIVQDTTDGVTNYIWRDHSASKLYLGTQDAVVHLRSALQINGSTRIDMSGNATLGTISSGVISASGGVHTFGGGSSDYAAKFTSTDPYAGIMFQDTDSSTLMYYRGATDKLYLHSADFAVNGSTLASGSNFQVNGVANVTSGLKMNNVEVITADRVLDNITGLDLDAPAGANQPVTLTFTDNISNQSITGIFIDYNASGSQAHTADNSHRALQIDFDSSATGGDITNEHRLYGIDVNVRATGDSDLVYGIYGLAEGQNSAGQISDVVGVYGYAVSDEITDGKISNIKGVQGLAYLYGQGSQAAATAYAGYFKTLATTAQDKNTGSLHGVYAEVEMDDPGQAQTVTNVYAYRAEIDNDGGSNLTVSNGYLFYGNYAGNMPSTAYGVYIPDNVKNYFAGEMDIRQDVFIGSSSDAARYIFIDKATSGENGIIFRNGGSNKARIIQDSSEHLRFKTNNNNIRMSILENGDVGVGASNPAAAFHVYNPYDVTSNTDKAGILLSRVSDTQRWLLSAGVSGVSNSYFAIRDVTGGAYRLVIDDSGSVLFGKSTTDLNTAGTTINAGGVAGKVQISRSSSPLSLNNTTDNGNSLNIYKGSSLIGDIGIEGGDSLYIQAGTTTGSGLRFHPSGGAISPVRNGALSSNTISLGTSTQAFKDAHFAGKVYANDIDIGGVTLTSSDNLNSLTDGFYKWSSSLPSNNPGSVQYMNMLQMTDPNQKIQLAWGGSSSGRMFVRRADSGTFYSWTEFFSTAHVPTLAEVTGSGNTSAVDINTSNSIQTGGVSRISSGGNLINIGSITANSTIQTTGTILEVGLNSGAVALTTNDGYGNANLCFNHTSGVPDVSGAACRIETNVDSSTYGVFTFEASSAAVTANTAVNLATLGTWSTQGFTTNYKIIAPSLEINGQEIIDSNRRIKNIADGSESAPGLYFGSDSDTGFWHAPAANFFNIVNNGSNSVGFGPTDTYFYRVVQLDSTGNATATTPNMTSRQSTDSNGSTRYHINFTKADGNTVLGRITTNNYATTYTETSDYRLKENVNYTWTATDRLKQLRPCQYNWISDPDDTTVDGFLAHEVADVAPQAVVGEKDAVDSEGNIDAQGVDNSKLVPLLVKTIQELEARIAALENA